MWHVNHSYYSMFMLHLANNTKCTQFTVAEFPGMSNICIWSHENNVFNYPLKRKSRRFYQFLKIKLNYSRKKSTFFCIFSKTSAKRHGVDLTGRNTGLFTSH